MRILAAGGGTAGHLFPALAVLEEFQKNLEVRILYVVVSGKIDERVVKRDHPSYETVVIKARGLYRPIYSPKNLKRVFQYIQEISKVRAAAEKFKPDFVFLTGGYAAGIVAMALKRRYKVFVHEQNAVPGLANIYASRFAERIFVSFESSKGYFPKSARSRIKVVGNPIRDVFYTKERMEIPDGIVLVMGGSLGSEEINSLMEKVYEIDDENIYVHSTGSREWTERLSRFPNVIARDFFESTPAIWRKAKFSITRAGATTSFEMMRYGVKGILIPWMGSAESHQIENARAVEKAGYGKILVDPSPETIVEFVRRAVYNHNFGVSNPAKLVYKEIMEAIR